MAALFYVPLSLIIITSSICKILTDFGTDQTQSNTRADSKKMRLLWLSYGFVIEF